MSDCKQKIEEHIADLHEWGRHDEASIIKALLDVAVAAENMTYADAVAGAETWGEMKQALDKLREVE